MENENETDLPEQITETENIELENFGNNAHPGSQDEDKELDIEMRYIDAEITTRL